MNTYQIYANISYDRQLAENSNGAYIIANCTDGKTFYLYRVLNPPLISNVAYNNLESDHLYHNYPNPFSSTTTINYYLAEESDVKIKIYNSIGQTIETVIFKSQPWGEHNYIFNAVDLKSGVYYYQIETETLCTGFNHINRLRETLLIYKEIVGFAILTYSFR